MTNPLLEEPVSHSLTLAMNEKSTSVTPDGEMCNVQQAKHPNLSRARTLAAAALLALSNLVPMTSWGAGVGSGLVIGKSIGVTETSQAAWIAASYPLTQGAFILMSGRLGAVYGHKPTLLLGAVWWVLWTMINGFCNNFIAFNVARGMSGIGGALVVPNAVAIIGITFPPGRMRNRIIGFFGAAAPVGGWLGSMLSGVLTEQTPWKWLFFTLAILGAIIFGALGIVLPPEEAICKAEKMDWMGSFLGIGGLILFNFVWNQVPAVGWQSAYEITLLIVALTFFAAFAVWEHRYATEPILPLRIFKAPSFSAMIVVVLMSFMAHGIFIWYMIAWQQHIRHWSVLSTALGLTPVSICAPIATIIAAWMIPRLAAQWILALGALAILAPLLIIAVMPDQQSYWPQVFPATVISATCPDFIYTAAQIIACSSVKRHEQGIAGSLVGVLQLYGASIGLGFAGLIEIHTSNEGSELSRGYRCALYFGVGLAAVTVLVSVAFVRMPKDTREGWQGEKAADPGSSIHRGNNAQV